MERSDIINYLIKAYNYQSYLEVGYGNGETFHKIELPLEKKTGIDHRGPQGDPNLIRITAADYFKLNRKMGNKRYDLIFIDASHLCEDVENDLTNSLDCLVEEGTIVMHDCLPPNRYYQERKQSLYVSGWTGDTWKAFVKFRTLREDLNMYVVDTDYGCGVVRRGKQNTLDIDLDKDLSYEIFEKNKTEWLNLITPEDFKKKESL